MVADSVIGMIENDHMNEISYKSRELVLYKLDEVINFLHSKALEGRVRKPENDKVRIQWFKTMIYACSIYNQISRDYELDNLREDGKKLKNL